MIMICVCHAGINAHACEPCPTKQMLTLKATMQRAKIVLVGKRLTPVATSLDESSWLESIDFEVHRVLKNKTKSPIKAQSRIKLNFMDGMCPTGFMIPHHDPVVIFIKHQDSHGVYQSVKADCAPTYLSIAQDGKVNLNTKTVTLDELELHLKSLTNRMTLTIDPDELSYDEAKGTMTYAPNRKVKRASYTYYVFKIKNVEEILGERPTKKTSLVVEVGEPKRSTYQAKDPRLAQPSGGFKSITYQGVVVGVSTKR